MSYFGSKYEELIRQITSGGTLKTVTRNEGVGSYQKDRPFVEEAKQQQIEDNTGIVVDRQIKIATYLSSTQVKLQNTNLLQPGDVYSIEINNYYTNSALEVFINGIFIPDEYYTYYFESPDLFFTFRTDLLGYNIEPDFEIQIIGKYTS